MREPVNRFKFNCVVLLYIRRHLQEKYKYESSNVIINNVTIKNAVMSNIHIHGHSSRWGEEG
jgi:hypothetical protein